MYTRKSSKLSEKGKTLNIIFDLKKIIRKVVMIIVLLVIMSSLGQIYKYVFSQDNFTSLINLTWLNGERNIPTIYASFSLLLCSVLLAIITKIKYSHQDRYRLHWRALSFIFFYLSIDEAASIHEISIEVMRKLFNARGFFYYAWVIPAMILLFLFVLVYFRFILALPKYTRLLFVTAGIIFVSGALGVEMIGAKIETLNSGQNSPIYSLVATIEEILEMGGIAIFIFALLKYINRYINCLKISIN